ncbi:GtrA domain-containing protein [Candidatus Hydrogenisulfobacillus filiaventi]|uniref:GtrA domain-containing protein n=1 Tax=Candidatus Hydrogenisulfobacillus filiaventi TaxID=2707344 RepID=A0A6F8ZJP3_9FIRM|nr:GtrA domain-containing protein [Candidatus Hydrogenisulfobacillus filiaventi]
MSARPPRARHQVARFALVGLANNLLDLGVFNLLYLLQPTHDVTRLVGYNSVAVAVAVVNSYVWNTRWTFRQQIRPEGAARRRTLFFSYSVLKVFLNDTVLGVLAAALLTAHLLPAAAAGNLAKLLATFLTSVTSFLVMKFVVFA